MPSVATSFCPFAGLQPKHCWLQGSTHRRDVLGAMQYRLLLRRPIGHSHSISRHREQRHSAKNGTKIPTTTD